MSNRSNLKEGVKYYRKNGAVEIEWDANTDVGEEVSRSIVKINKSFFNSYVEHAWRFDLVGVAWSNILLQAAYDAREKINDEELTQDNQGSWNSMC